MSGICVLTGTDLEQASVRTGPERTLTTTLIIRPWAYVGLSEDSPSGVQQLCNYKSQVPAVAASVSARLERACPESPVP